MYVRDRGYRILPMTIKGVGDNGGESSKSYFKLKIHFIMTEDFNDWKILYFSIMYHMREELSWEIISPNFTSVYTKLSLRSVRCLHW